MFKLITDKKLSPKIIDVKHKSLNLFFTFCYHSSAVTPTVTVYEKFSFFVYLMHTYGNDTVIIITASNRCEDQQPRFMVGRKMPVRKHNRRECVKSREYETVSIG